MPTVQVPYDSFARPANTTQYAANDIVANSATAADVIPLVFNVGIKSGYLDAARFYKSGATVTAASFEVHLFSAVPVVANGDNGAWTIDTAKDYLGVIACDLSSSSHVGTVGAWQTFAFLRGTQHSVLVFDLDRNASEDYKIYGLIKVKGTYTPESGETFNIWLECAST